MLFSDQDFAYDKCEKILNELLKSDDDPYWNYNYRFGKAANNKFNLAGKDRIADIITNAIIPLVYLYAQIFKNDTIRSNILDFFKRQKIYNKNSILWIVWKQLLKPKGILLNTSAIEQAVIQLYNFYCSRGRCDQCKIGMSFVKEKGFDYRIIFY